MNSGREYFGRKRIYKLGNKIAEGGEGAIYSIEGDESSVIKIYFNADNEIEQKIEFMCSNPPACSVLNDLAWPTDVIRDGATDKFLGFVMPKLITDCELSHLYKYNDPKAGIPPVMDYKKRISVAINLCKVIDAVHKAGYIFGDFNPLNIGVNLTNANIGFFDADSFHIFDSQTNTQYRCKVGCNGYIAPELLKKCKSRDPWYTYEECPLPTFTLETDRFALAIHIFKLLMNGFTPFNGIKEDESASTASPGIGSLAVERDSYCFKPGNKPLSAATPDLKSFPEYLSSLWQKAFIDGKELPECRPSAEEWLKALEKYDADVIQCSNNGSHFYWKDKKNKLAVCPYCEADKRQDSQQNQKTFKTPISIPKQSTVAKKKKPNSKVLAIFITVIVFVASIIGIIFGVRSCSNGGGKANYDSNNFVIKIENKKEIKNDYYNFYVNCDFSITNNSSISATDLYGTIVFQNSYHVDLVVFNVSFSGEIKPGATNSYTTEFKCPTNNEKNELFYSTSYKDLAVMFKWTNIYFSNNTCKTYENNYSYIKESGEDGKDSSYDTIANLKNAKVGSIVKFGQYEMDTDILNGLEYITWKVLSISDNKALMISEKILIDMPYSSSEDYTTWENSLIRNYLNGTFVSKYFTNEEKSVLNLINSTPSQNEMNKGARSTNEYVTIFTSDELEGYFPISEDRNAEWTGNMYSELEDDIGSIYLDLDSLNYNTYWCKNAYFDNKDNSMSQYEFVYNKVYKNPMFAFEDNFSVTSGVRPVIKVNLS